LNDMIVFCNIPLRKCFIY